LRNNVTISDYCVEKISKIESKLYQYKNDSKNYIKALIETLEADIRSKFQTRKLIENTSNGVNVKILFDETIVRFEWLEDKKFNIIDIDLVNNDNEKIEELEFLNNDNEEAEEEIVENNDDNDRI
jgi:hypothetical protein